MMLQVIYALFLLWYMPSINADDTHVVRGWEDGNSPISSIVEDTDKVPFSHALWDELLKRYVSHEGHVKYKEMLAAKGKLEKYLAQLASHVPDVSWSRTAAMAYWINAYNAFTVKLILDHYPVTSIRDIHKGNPWDVRWIELGDKRYSLNEIEHEILRKRYGDARIHFAVNCAARSCPPLYNRAFTPDNLDEVLDQRAQRFINNPAFNRVTPTKAALSKIFEWYRSDFGDLISYINRYSEVKLQPNAKIFFLEYDWHLNE